MEWKIVEGKYEVSDTGLVRNSETKLILKTRLDRYGYELVTLWVDGAITRKVHRLVAIAFIDNPANLPTVNHIDGIKTNNNKNNLEWNSVKENHQHAFAIGLHTVGENRNAGKPVKLKNDDIVKIRKLFKEGFGNTEIGKRFGVSCGCIYSIRVGKNWTHI